MISFKSGSYLQFYTPANNFNSENTQKKKR